MGACVLPVAPAMAQTWVPAAGGSFEWQNAANWTPSLPTSSSTVEMRTAGQTGDQIIRLAEPVRLVAFYPGSRDSSRYSQTLTGESVTCSGSFRVMGGHVILENSLLLTGQGIFHNLGQVRPGKLTLRGNSRLWVTNGILSVGFKQSAYEGGAGSLCVEDGAVLHSVGTINGVYLGRLDSGTAKNPGKVWQSGGTVRIENGLLVGNHSDGYYRLESGELDLPHTSSARALQGASYSLLHIGGGRLYRSGAPNYNYIVVGDGNKTTSTQPGYAEIYLAGQGVLDSPDTALVVNSYSGGTLPHSATLTVDDSAVFRGRNIGLGDSGAPAATRATLNLNGGLCSLTYYLSRFGGADNESTVNFNGGTLQWRGLNAPSPISGISNIVVYSRGGVLDTTQLTIETATPQAASFRTAKGWGVRDVIVSAPGADYGAAPRVAVTGGSGSNAAAVAVMTKTGTVERVAVTCPGEGYAPDDVLTVSFITDSGFGFGGGAAATAVLAENTPGTLTKKGVGGTWRLVGTNTFDGAVKVAEGYLNLNEGASFPALRTLVLAGGFFTSQSFIDDAVNPDATLELTGGAATSAYQMQRPAQTGDTNSQSFARLHAHHGVSVIRSLSTDGGASELRFNGYDRLGSLVGFTPTPAGRVWLASNAHISPSAVSPVVSGFVTEDGMNILEREPDSGYLRVAETSGAPAADGNFLVPSGWQTGAVANVNSLLFADLGGDQSFWFGTSGQARIRSGMILSRRRGGSVQRVATLPGGTLTTDIPGGLVIYERGNGSRSLANMDAAGARRFLISATLSDPSAGQPMPVTLAGPPYTPATGALVRFMNANTFSGGLYLANGGLWYDGDAMLGAAGSPVIVSGTCSLTPVGNTLETASGRPIEIRPDAALQLLSRTGYGAHIRGPLFGSGNLLTGEAGLRTYAEFSGDHTAFAGRYYVLGAVRVQTGGAPLSTNANIRFADNGNGFGTLDMPGTFTRPLGTGAGTVCWQKHPSTGGLYGGFSAYGGDLTVNLHGDGRTLAYGSEALPANAVVYLQNRDATGVLSFENGLDLKGLATPHIRVSTDLEKTARLKGVISDSVGGGTLIKGGQGVLVLERSPTMNGTLSITSGKVRLAEGVSLDTLSKVSIAGDGKALEIAGTQAVQTVACTITGSGALTVSGGGVTVLPGTNTYAGITVVTNGSTLLVNGEHVSGGNYHVAGTLGGTGTVAPAAGCRLVFGPGSRLSPGGPGMIGVLTLGTAETTNAVELTGATLEIDLSPTGTDKAVVAGDIAVAEGTDVFILDTDESLLKSLRGKVLTVCEWAGRKVGSFAAKTNVQGWAVVEDLSGKRINLVYITQGTLVGIR
jgi:hypothetical protein